MKSKYLLLAFALGVAVLMAGGAFAQMRGASGMHGQTGASSDMHGQMHAMMHGGQMHGGGHGMMHGGHMSGSGDGGAAHTHGANRTAKGDQGPASLAFQGINAKMHQGMDIALSGDADADFIRGMIPHHQGAVDMAKVVIAFGKDPEIRKLAEGIIKAQQDEIAWMNSWLQKTANK